MEATMRLEGLYDKKTIQVVQQEAKMGLTFDFRPRSFNFIQQYLFLDFISEVKKSTNEFSIQYENEPEFMINDTLEKLSKIFYGNFLLEFSDNQTLSYYEQFKKPFLWHYSQHIGDISVFKSPLLKGIVLDYNLIKDAHESGKLNNFVQNFYRLTHDTLIRRSGQLILKMDWASDIMPSITEFFDFNCVSLPVNSNIEICYRNVDQNKLKTSISSLKSFTKSL